MISVRTIRLVAKILSPLVYAAAVVPVVVGVFGIGPFLYSAIESVFPLAIYFILPYLIIGGAIYGLWSWLLLLLERLQRPTLLDHLRYCALLYPFVIFLAPLVVAFVPMDDPGGGGVIAIIAVTAAGCALLVNALVLLTRRLRFDRASSSGAA